MSSVMHQALFCWFIATSEGRQWGGRETNLTFDGMFHTIEPPT
jgi:hypothetical protein